jgi:hypothetical protein
MVELLVNPRGRLHDEIGDVYGPCRDRTYDLGIKSPLLYQLS